MSESGTVRPTGRPILEDSPPGDAPSGDAPPGDAPLKVSALGLNLFRLDAVQRLPIAPEAAWRFFSDPRNLREITPPALRLTVDNDIPAEMHPGMIITYRVRPLPGLPLRWVTEITHAVPGRLFVDEQRFGPYRFWHHQHHFREIPGGVEMRDIVHYKLPLGPLARLGERLLVRPQLAAIFAHRAQALARRFGCLEAAP